MLPRSRSLRAQRSNPESRRGDIPGLLRCARNDACVVRTSLDPLHLSWHAHLRIPAARFARAWPGRAPRLEERAQGRPGADWLPWPPVQKVVCVCRHRRKTTGQPGHPGLPCAMVGTAYVALSPGSVALLPPSPRGSPTRRPGRAARVTARLGARTPGARTTRFCRTRIPFVESAPSCSRLPALQNPSRQWDPCPPPPGPMS